MLLINGTFTVGADGDLETPLVEGGKLVLYVTKSNNGTLHCGIERAYRNGKIQWKKPISCHLYPIRLKELIDFTALNYHQWNICEGARSVVQQRRFQCLNSVRNHLSESLVRIGIRRQ